LKKALPVLPFFLFLCYSILPLFCIIGWICGYSFILNSYPIYSIALAIISILAASFLFMFNVALNKINYVLSALLLPMSFVNGICCHSHSNTKLTVIFTLIGCCCAIAIYSKFASPRALKIVSGILSALLFLFLLLVLIVGILKSTIVVKSVPSPQNKYLAEVIDDDQGALGGNTLVDVKDNSQTIDLLVGKFSKQPTCVYTGKWGEFTNMQISWKSEHVLIIDGKEYHIEK
jgi:hypothetical protein